MFTEYFTMDDYRLLSTEFDYRQISPELAKEVYFAMNHVMEEMAEVSGDQVA